MYTIILTRSFRAKVKEIESQELLNNSKLNFNNKVDKMVNHLSTFPLLFVSIGLIDGVEIRKAYLKPYNIFYTVNEDGKEILILDILHYREYFKSSN